MQPHVMTTDVEAWCGQMLSFFCRCVEGTPSQQMDRIREASALFRQVPDDLDIAPVLADKGRVESLLMVGAAESAALALVDRDAGFMLSRGTNGAHLATVIPPGQTQEYTATGGTDALALLAAQTAALLAEAGQLDVYPADAGSRAVNEPRSAVGK